MHVCTSHRASTKQKHQNNRSEFSGLRWVLYIFYMLYFIFYISFTSIRVSWTDRHATGLSADVLIILRVFYEYYLANMEVLCEVLVKPAIRDK